MESGVIGGAGFAGFYTTYNFTTARNLTRDQVISSTVLRIRSKGE